MRKIAAKMRLCKVMIISKAEATKIISNVF